MIKQKYIVMLDETPDKQVWLAYDNLGRIGNAKYAEAYRYDSEFQARLALRQVRRIRAWPKARILGTTVDVDVK